MENDFVNLTPDGGVLKRILQEGQGDSPQTNSICKIYYLGTLEDQKPFDSNMGQSQPSKHILFRGDRCKGFEIALKSMKPGEKSQFKITPQYGYGQDGNIFKNVPKNADLRYEIELISFKLEKKKRWQLIPEEKHQEALKLRTKGTKEFKNQRYQQAKEKYKDALTYCILNTKEGKELKASLQLNLSICCFLREEFKESIDYAKAALDTNSNDQQNIKAYYRRAIAFQQIGEQEQALLDLKSASKLDPQNALIIEELYKVKQHLKSAYTKEKESWSKLFKDKDINQETQKHSILSQEQSIENQDQQEKDENFNQITQASDIVIQQELPETINNNTNEQIQNECSENSSEKQKEHCQQEELIVTQASLQESDISLNIKDQDDQIILK